jgi:hypothetical protein
MSTIAILIIVLLILAVFALPTWPYSRGWGHGYFPAGGLFILVIILAVLMLTGVLGDRTQ